MWYFLLYNDTIYNSMKTIYITEAQKKKIKKAIAAQDQVGGKVNSGLMVYGGGMCENIEEDNLGPYFETWYRGYDSKYPNLGVPKNQGMWITDEIEYAKLYADGFGKDGKIAKVVIDIRKVKHISEGDMFDMDIDPYYSDETTCEIVKKQGYNSWLCYYWDYDAQGLCLIDSTPIVSIEDVDIENLEENVEDDTYELGAEKGMSPYYHVIKESPDRVWSLYGLRLYFNDSEAIPFFYSIETNTFYVGKPGERHLVTMERLGLCSEDEMGEDDFSKLVDIQRTGRYWPSANVISFWETPLGNTNKMVQCVTGLANETPVDIKYLVVDYWDGPKDMAIPYKWFTNGTYNMLNEIGVFEIYADNSEEYVNSRKYSKFTVCLRNGQRYNMDVDGNMIENQYAYAMREGVEDSITLYHGVNRKGLEFNLGHGGFIPRVCSEGGPKAVWLSENQYNYEFTFAFDMPKSVVEQLSNVDYVYTNEIRFDEFNCRLVRSSLHIYLDSSAVVEVNLLNDKLSKLHFRYFPDLGMLLWKEYKEFPLILEKYINPYIEKYQTLQEGIKKENRMIDIKQVVNSPNFIKWFGDWRNNPESASKVVDSNGFPLIVHHGSPNFKGDSFDKNKIGHSINGGEEGMFCTTQDMEWAKRFSYPASPGTFSFTVKVDYSKPGDILSGFLNMKHPLDLFNLSEQDIENMFQMNIKYDEFGQAFLERDGLEKYHDYFVKEIKKLIDYNNHQLIKHYIHRNLGNALKEFGYDGFIANMQQSRDENPDSKEYCFIDPNQFKSIYSIAFNPESDSIYENIVKESPDMVWSLRLHFEDDGAVPFMYYNRTEKFYVGEDGQKHIDMMTELGATQDDIKAIQSIGDAFEQYVDVERTGRYWPNADVISFWQTPLKNRQKLISSVNNLSQYVDVDVKYLLVDYWDGSKDMLIPYRWLLNGTYDMLDSLGIFDINPNDEEEYIKTKKYTSFYVVTQRGGRNNLDISGNFMENQYAYALSENVESEIVNPEDIDLSSFNIKKKLNPKFWKDGILDSRIRMKLLDIADDFIEFLGVDWAKPEDITMTGSLANFNWDEKYSDIDLHIIMDYSDVDERTDFVSNYFYSQKKLWNEEHSDINIMGFPVEVFVQDVNERHDSSGVYSLEKNRWLIEPEREKLASSKVNKSFIKDRVSDHMNKIDKLEYLFNKAKDDEYKLRRVLEKSDALFDKIKTERKLGFEKSGGREINNLNIVFKALRRNGYIEKLVNIKSMAYDKLKSLL